MSIGGGSVQGATRRLQAWRAGVRRTPGGALALKVGTLVLGLAFIALGFVLIVLPGPLTIPPIVLGLWILSSEFAWADRLFARARDSGRKAARAAQRKPVATGVTTVGGILAAGVVIWAVVHYELVAKAQEAVGL